MKIRSAFLDLLHWDVTETSCEANRHVLESRSLPRCLWRNCDAILSWGECLRAGTHYPHVTWAHVMLRVKLGCERRFNVEFCGADSHFCHSAYVTWSHV